jgi:hypothetical protein
MKYRVAQYHLTVEADSPEQALATAKTSPPDVFWTFPTAEDAPTHVTDPAIEHARWLLEEWAIRGSNSTNEDLVEETKIAAQLLLRQHG